MKIVTIEQMRAIETRSERAGVSTETLMDNAGLAVAELDVPSALETARRAMFHLRDRRPETYAAVTAAPMAGAVRA